MTSKILVIGSGAWGTALALLLAKQKSRVNLLTRNQSTLNEINNSHSNDKYLPKIKLPNNIYAINEFNGDYDFVFIALPSNNIAEIFLKISQIKFNKNCCFVICSKGLIEDSLEFFSNAFERIIGHKNYAILSGPNFAIEVAQDLPTISTIACLDHVIYNKISSIISNPNDFGGVSGGLSTKKSIELKHIYEIESKIEYDLVIIYRYDVLLWVDMLLDNYNTGRYIYVNGWDGSKNADFHFVMSNENSNKFKYLYDSVKIYNNKHLFHNWIKNYVLNIIKCELSEDSIIAGKDQEHMRVIGNDTILNNVLHNYR